MTRRTKLAEATDELNRLVQDRFELMPAVAHYKWHSGKPIEDLGREQVLLVQVAELAESQGACPRRS
ncbi:MAG: chorismate mutase [Planctomycetota bacterium]